MFLRLVVKYEIPRKKLNFSNLLIGKVLSNRNNILHTSTHLNPPKIVKYVKNQ